MGYVVTIYCQMALSVFTTRMTDPFWLAQEFPVLTLKVLCSRTPLSPGQAGTIGYPAGSSEVDPAAVTCHWLATDSKSHLLCFSVSSILCNSRTRHSNWDFSSPRTLLQASHCRSFSSSSSFRASRSMTCSSSIVQVVFRASIVCKSVSLSCALYQRRTSQMLLLSDQFQKSTSF